MSRNKYNYAQEVCIKSAGRIMQGAEMLWPGAKVGVAASGGMDSWALLKVLQIRQRIVPFHFDFMALHLNPGFDNTSHAPLVDWLRANGVAGHIELTDHGVRAHSEENRTKSACFLCAMLRRKRLFELCRQYGLTHLAFGHNADDLVSTFFLNLCQTGRVSGMSAKEAFFGGQLMVIRPLLMVEKALIAKAVKQWALPVWSNPCPSASGTRRSEMLAEVLGMCGDRKWMKKNIFNGLGRWQYEQALEGLGQAKLDELPEAQD